MRSSVRTIAVLILMLIVIVLADKLVQHHQASVDSARASAKPDAPAVSEAALPSYKWSVPEPYQTWIETNGTTNIRSSNSMTAMVVLKASAHSDFPLIRTKGKWDAIRIGANQTAWVADWVVRRQTLHKPYQSVTISNHTSARRGPDDAFQERTTLASSNQTYIPLEVEGDWVHIVQLKTANDWWVPVGQVHWKYAPLAAQDITQMESVSVSAVPSSLPLNGKTIVVDPGHGGNDVGASGKNPKLYERDINLAAALVLESKLKAAGAHVIMTRTKNKQYVSLADRTAVSNSHSADAFVSIHQNMFAKDPSITGTITYYYNANTSIKLARDIETATLNTLRGPGAKNQVVHNELYVLHHNTQPSVLVEGCFLSNPNALVNSQYPDYDDKLASGIFHGLLKFFNASS